MNDSRPESAAQPVPPAKRRSSSFLWLLALLIAGMVLVVEFPNQRRAWKFAAALEARDAGDKTQATQLLDELLKQRPADEQYRAVQYLWNKEDAQYEAALEYLRDRLSGTPEGTEIYVQLISERSRIYQHLRRHAEALADCQELVRLNEKIGKPDRQDVLNGLAYARALAGQELDAALKDIEVALATARANLNDAEEILRAAVAAEKRVFAAQSLVTDCRRSLLACVDTRGLVYHKQADFAAAERDFDEAVENVRRVREFYRVNEKTFTKHEREYKTYAKQQKLLDHNDAVIYYHRSLNRKALGRDEDAQLDWKKARELLGREPDETLF